MKIPGLKDIFKLFLFFGGRNEEVLSLKWNDSIVSDFGATFFMMRNLKVDRIQNTEDEYIKPAAIGEDLENLLNTMGWKEHIGADKKILKLQIFIHT